MTAAPTDTRATVTEAAPAGFVTPVAVTAAERISPAFVRITLGAPALADLAALGHDTRFKLVLPGPTGRLPEPAGTQEEWYASWMAMPDDERAFMRTYTVRDVVGEGASRRLVVDFVVHDEGGSPGLASDTRHGIGPACRWALSAGPGDRAVVVVPHRHGSDWGGTEFAPGSARDLLLIGDETAVPAIARILADADPTLTGRAFLEVPCAADQVPLPAHPGIEVTWVTRDNDRPGRRLVGLVRSELGLPAVDLDAPQPAVRSSMDVEVWETPRFSSAGEDLQAQLASGTGRDLAGTYAWIAGESWLVKTLRRALVSELQVDRVRVAFMGYWREGVAMRS
jgi:NADPH-dependent ferric siderophore reductase